MPRRVTVGDEVLIIMSEALNFQPTTVSFPEDSVDDGAVALELVDEAAIVRTLRQALPVDDLLHWLHEHFPELTDATVLRVYHALIARTEWGVTSADMAGIQNLNTVRVTHYPHALTHVIPVVESST